MRNKNLRLPPRAYPMAPWIGGKQKLARQIAKRIDAMEYQCYAEPFCGMASVFFRRERRTSELLNDINGDIVNLFRVTREHPDELMRQFEWMIASRSDHYRMQKTPPETMTDIQRAARFLYLQNLNFRGTMLGIAGVNFAAGRKARLRRDRVFRLIRAANRRLQGVQVEHMEWDRFIHHYDRPFTLFYIDPPYWGHTDDYGKDLFTEEDFSTMADILGSLKGRFILSLNDRPEVREVFGEFQMEEVMARWALNPNKPKVGELLISN